MQAARVAADEKADESARREAIQLLAFTNYAVSGGMLLDILHKDPSQTVQVAAVTALAKFNDPQVAAELIKGWADYPDRIRSEVKAALLGRSERVIALLNAIAAGTLKPTDLTTAQMKFIRNHRDPEVRTWRRRFLRISR